MAKGINGKHARTHNESVVLDLIRRYQPISRYEIAEISGLTPATISSLVNQLVSMGVVLEGSSGSPRGHDRGGGGRPPIPLSLVVTSKLAGGILVNRTGIDGVVVDLGGNIHAQAHQDRARGLFKYAVAEVAQALSGIRQDLLQALPPQERAVVLGYGVAVPSHLPTRWSWEEVLTAIKPDSWKPTMVWSNNAVASAYGEWWVGSLPTVSSVLYVFLGGGIGGCWVQCLNAHAVPIFQPFEIGHLGVVFDGAPCYCGGLGCLEAVIPLGHISIDDPVAQSHLAYALRSLTLMFELDVIVLGGPWAEHMSSSSVSALESAIHYPVKVQRSRISGMARAVGTAATVFQDHFIPCFSLVSQEDGRLDQALRRRARLTL